MVIMQENLLLFDLLHVLRFHEHGSVGDFVKVIFFFTQGEK